MVLSRVLMSQPKITLEVVQVASPFFSFLIDAGSWWIGVSSSSKGRKTLSRDWNSMHLIIRRVHLLPCTRPQTSSTYMSQYLMGRLEGLVGGIAVRCFMILNRLGADQLPEFDHKGSITSGHLDDQRPQV